MPHVQDDDAQGGRQEQGGHDIFCKRPVEVVAPAQSDCLLSKVRVLREW